MKLLLWLILLTLIQGCAHVPEPQYNYTLTSTGPRVVKWKIKQLDFYCDPYLPKLYYSAIIKAAHTWNKASVTAPRLVFHGAMTQSQWNSCREMKNCPDQTIIWSPRASKQNKNTQAITNSWWDEKSYLQTRMIIFTKDFKFSLNPKDSEVDVESLMVHEFGHALGLLHSEDYLSPMFSSLGDHELRRTLLVQDKITLLGLYPPAQALKKYPALAKSTLQK